MPLARPLRNLLRAKRIRCTPGAPPRLPGAVRCGLALALGAATARGADAQAGVADSARGPVVAVRAAAGQPAPTATLRGVAFDSLAGRPLAGAAVFVEGAALTAVADSGGRFTVADVPAGRQLVTAEHPTLAGLGLSALTAAVEVAGDSAAVTLATPGRAALWRRMCGAEPPREGAIVFGDVRDARTAERLAGAEARVSWTAVEVAGRRVRMAPRALAARTDSLGVFRACGVPTDAEVEVRAGAGALESGRTTVRLDGRGLTRVDLLLGRDSAAAAVRVTGVVRDTTGAPLAGARVEVDGLDGVAATADDAGRFALAAVPAGSRTVVVRAIGFAPVSVPVAIQAPMPGPLELTVRRVTQLTGVTVRVAAARRSLLVDAIAKRRRLGQNDVVDTLLLQRTGQLRSALLDVPFVRIGGPLSAWYVVLPARAQSLAGAGAGGCLARVFVDHLERDWDFARDLPPDQIAAIEVFRTPARIPVEYGGTSIRGACGAVMIWTRSAL